MDVEDTPTFLGYASVDRSLIYLLDVFQVAFFGHTGIPRSIHSLTIPKFSALGLHWSLADPECFIEKDLEAFFSQGTFPKALSFWVDTSAITVWQSTILRPAPRAFAKFEISNALAMAVEAGSQQVIFYVARENPGRIEKYDMTRPTHLSSLEPMATTVDTVRFGSPNDVTLLRAASETLVVAVDSRIHKVMLFDTDLNLIESKSIWEGMSRPLERPTAIFCIETPSQKGTVELFDCYITDRGNQRLLLIQYNITSRVSTFISEVSSSQDSGQRLMDPQMVVAYPYNGFTLIYVAEVGSEV